MTASRVVLLRHGRTASNAAGLWQGQLDVPLDEVGRSQAAAAAAALADLDPVAIVSSDLSRASETAGALAALTGLDVQTDPALREVDAGRWQGLSRAEIATRWPGDLAAWSAGEDVRVGGGESRREVAARTAAAIRRHAEPLDDGVLVVTSHGGALRGAVCELLGLPTVAWGAFGGLGNCCWGSLEESRHGWYVHSWNVGG